MNIQFLKLLKVRFLIVIVVGMSLVLGQGCSKSVLGSASLFGGKNVNLPFQETPDYADQQTEINMKQSLADQHYQNQEFAQAAKLYKELLAVDANQPRVYYRLGNIAFREKQLRLANYYFQKSLELEPTNNKAHYNLAVTNLSIAERHFKFYTATLPADSDVSRMTQILSAIDQFSGKSPESATQSDIDRTLDQLTDELQ